MSFDQFDVSLAKFKDYPLWPVRIVKASKGVRGNPIYMVFCYGSHDDFRLIDANLQVYYPSIDNSTAPATKKAFDELAYAPEIFKRLSKTYLALKGRDKGKPKGSTSSISQIQQQLVATQAELDKTKNVLMATIIQKITEKLASSNSLKESTETIVSQIYDDVTHEFNHKFQLIEKSLKGLKNELEYLEEN